MVHGLCLFLFAVWPWVPHNGNMGMSIFMVTLWLVQGQLGRLPSTWYMQGDGGPENKNRWFFGLCELLVHQGVLLCIEYHFLPPGHSH